MTLLSAAVIGLGQAGSRFDEEPRKSIWSHVGAFLVLSDQYRLVGGVDIDSQNRKAFSRRCSGVPVYESVREMADEVRPDVVSLSTPPEGRTALVHELFTVHRPKVLICEKPMETSAIARQEMVDQCRENSVSLLVHYNRRYASVYQAAKKAVTEGRIGNLVAITVLAPNRLWSIGSHAVNVLLYLAGESVETWTAMPLPKLDEMDEPAADLLCRFPSGTAGRVVTAGYREALIFEVDMLGTEGRLRVLDNMDLLEMSTFQPSEEADGYRVLGPSKSLAQRTETESSFVEIARCAAKTVRCGVVDIVDGQHALKSEAIVEKIAEQVQKD